MYPFLNYFFFVFHTGLILFNTFGFIPKKTRKANLITLSLTAFSWFVLGIWYGWGYCLFTDLHWQVREHLGYLDNDISYTHFLAYKLTGINFSQKWTDIVTAADFFISFALSVFLNVRDWRRKRNISPS
jgi:hypothetical protein